jgi:hypothetical protein
MIKTLMNVIPDDTQNLIMAIGDNISNDKWRLGDIVNEIKDIVTEENIDASMLDVYGFVSMLTGQQVSARTVEYYASLSLFYDRLTRERYSVLSHSHFAKARTYESNWQDCLEYMMSYLEMEKRAPSVNWVDKNYNPPNKPIMIDDAEEMDCSTSYEKSKFDYLLDSIIRNLHEIAVMLDDSPNIGIVERVEMIIDELKLMSIDKIT